MWIDRPVKDPADAAALVDKAIIRCREDDVDEIRALGRTLSRWRTEILNHYHMEPPTDPPKG